jgi:nucleoside-diphosphate-sugar epimerase
MTNIENLKGKNIALIGGAGFIGHNLALHLKNYGANVSVIDGLEVNNITSVLGNTDNLPHPQLAYEILNQRLKLLSKAEIPLYVQDVRDYHGLSYILTAIKPQIIFHLAAVSHANRSNKDPYSTFDHSLRTLENALDNARGRVEHFIFFSSSMVYGNFKEAEATEDKTCEPLGIYGALKFAGEKMVIAYNQVFGLPYTIVRPSALYGERCISRRVGQVFIENALNSKDIVVEGNGSSRLDFTYISDLLSGLTKIILHEESKNEIFNLTYGSSKSILDMLLILKEFFPDINVINRDKDSLVPERGTLSVEKAKKLIDYQPKWPLEHGYREYIKWYIALKEKNPKLFLSSYINDENC